jgi:hypothetical protein
MANRAHILVYSDYARFPYYPTALHL